MLLQESLTEKLEQITSISLLEDLQNMDNKIRINAIHNLRSISLALGSETTRKELLPYLKNCINNEEEDEILIELTKILSNFLDCMGGVAYTSELLNLFGVLLSIDEPTIRKEAINSLKEVLNQIGGINNIEKDLMEIINKFYWSDDVNQKLSAMNLIILLYNDLNENNKKIVMNYLENFLNSDNLLIKKELMNEIVKITCHLNIDYIKKLISIITKDDNNNDNIRENLINVLISLKSHKDLNFIINFIYDLIIKLSEDNNWKVRLSLINNFSEILKFPKINYNFKQMIINIYIKFIEDSEEMIRNACCINLEDITKLLKNEINFNKILQNLEKLSKDEKISVKKNLSENIFKIFPLLNAKQINEIIFKVFNILLNDDNLDIKINIIQNIAELSQTMDLNNFIEKIIPSIISIAQNKSWRLRNKIINIIPSLVNQNFFMNDIFPICLNYLTDHVYAIRESGSKLLCNIYIDIYKNKENLMYEKKLNEKLDNMINLSNYLMRNTCLIFIKFFCEKIEDKIYFNFFEKNLINYVYKLSNDKISNVRLNCGFIFNKIKNYEFNDKMHKDKIKKWIAILKNDEDKDVRIIFNSE